MRREKVSARFYGTEKKGEFPAPYVEEFDVKYFFTNYLTYSLMRIFSLIILFHARLYLVWLSFQR